MQSESVQHKNNVQRTRPKNKFHPGEFEGFNVDLQPMRINFENKQINLQEAQSDLSYLQN